MLNIAPPCSLLIHSHPCATSSSMYASDAVAAIAEEVESINQSMELDSLSAFLDNCIPSSAQPGNDLCFVRRVYRQTFSFTLRCQAMYLASEEEIIIDRPKVNEDTTSVK